MRSARPAAILCALFVLAGCKRSTGTPSPPVQAAYELSEWMKKVKPEEAGKVGGFTDKARACIDALAAMTKAGKPDDHKLQLDSGREQFDITIADARKMCEQTLVDAQAFEGAVSGREGGQRAALEEKWKAAGFQGDRLKLMVDNELNGFPWYGEGCDAEITDPAELKTAGKLFHWTNGQQPGSTLVTKYTFEGDKYKVASREYIRPDEAYDYCK